MNWHFNLNTMSPTQFLDRYPLWTNWLYFYHPIKKAEWNFSVNIEQTELISIQVFWKIHFPVGRHYYLGNLEQSCVLDFSILLNYLNSLWNEPVISYPANLSLDQLFRILLYIKNCFIRTKTSTKRKFIKFTLFIILILKHWR